jgi:hypothetical protein
MLLCVRKRGHRLLAGFFEAAAVLQDVDDVCLRSSGLVNRADPHREVERGAELGEADLELAEIDVRHAQRVEGVGLDLGLIGRPGRCDGSLADDLGATVVVVPPPRQPATSATTNASTASERVDTSPSSFLGGLMAEAARERSPGSPYCPRASTHRPGTWLP